MSDHSRPIVLTVRNRPVSFQPGKWGGGLHAVERGYFPISGTGYRSLSGLYGAHGDDAAAEISAEFLEALAANQDRERRSVLARLARPLAPGADPLSNYVSASIDADKALEEGFFAPDTERADLWRGAFSIYALIDANPRFQPAPRSDAWTEAHCAEALSRVRESLAFLRQLASGDFPAAPLGRHLSASAYFALPPKPDGERGFVLPALTGEFSFNLTTVSTPPRAVTRAKPAPTESGEETGQLPLL